MLRVLDYFFFARPVLFFPAWSTLLLLSKDVPLNGMIFFITACVMGSCFVINQIADVESDKINGKCLFLNESIISYKQAILYAALLFILSISFSTTYQLFLVCIFFLVTGVLYNLKPFHWKQFPFLGALANFLMGFFIAFFAYPDLSFVNEKELVGLSVLNFVVYILTTLPDIKGDKRTQKRTIGVVLGEQNSIFLCIVFSVVNFFLLSDRTELLLIQTILFGLLVFQSLAKRSYIIVMIKIVLMAQALVACFFYPFYLILILGMFFGGRWYYKKRFSLTYPSFENE